MESVKEFKMIERDSLLKYWLEVTCSLGNIQLCALPHDASFRRYYRIQVQDRSFIVMDAPPSLEDCRPYIKIAEALRRIGLQTPTVFAAELSQGFLLLSDFGDLTYLRALSEENADALYTAALQALIMLQQCPDKAVPSFDATWMQQEWQWHQEWFLTRWLELTPLSADVDAAYAELVKTAISQPQVWMHRDYHSANLMVLPTSEVGRSEVGILDFQDAFQGPLTYDLVSLLRDCYIDWPKERIEKWVYQYWQKGQIQERYNVELSTLQQWFDWMGVQRHIKALFTFARKHVRDHQSQYLIHIPRTVNYIVSVTQAYTTLKPLYLYYRDVVSPALEKKHILCAQ